MILINQVPRNIVIVAVVKLLKTETVFFCFAQRRFSRSYSFCPKNKCVIFFFSVRVRMCGVCLCLCVPLWTFFTLLFPCLLWLSVVSKMVIFKCIVRITFQKLFIVFPITYAFDKYQTSLHVYHYLPPFWSCYLASFIFLICCYFEQKETNG